MTSESGGDYVVVDTQVLSWFTKRNPTGDEYRRMLGDRTIALSYFAETELNGYDWGPRRRERLEALYAECVPVPPTAATQIWYNRAKKRRKAEDLISKVGDTDLWILSHAAEHRVPFMSHDEGACVVLRASASAC